MRKKIARREDDLKLIFIKEEVRGADRPESHRALKQLRNERQVRL